MSSKVAADSIDAILPGGSAGICCLLTCHLIREHVLWVTRVCYSGTWMALAEPSYLVSESRSCPRGRERAELPFLASVNDMLSPTELQSAHKTRLVLPSASWAFWWYDNAHFSNPHETNCLRFWKKLDRNVLLCLHFCHKSFSEPKMAELRFKHDILSSVEFMTGFYSL